MTPIPQEGQSAPTIDLTDNKGNPFQLDSLRGKKVVLYFYPKADTPGCTVEACEFRTHIGQFDSADAVVLGISPDGSSEQADFRDKFNLPFTLLADSKHEAAEAYGVWKERVIEGKTMMAVERTTFIIDENGVIRKVFRKVKPEGHATEVFAALQELNQ